jgi:hypothetical protein
MNIVTNPPYKYAQKFVEHALECVDKKIAMLLKLVFLESMGRKSLFDRNLLKKVYIFRKRLQFGSGGSPTLASAWFVWDKSYKGLPTIEWI